MAAIKIPQSWLGIGALATNKPLSDTSLPNTAQRLSLPSQSQSIALSGALGTVTVTADANCAFAVINVSTDQNIDGYFNLPPSPPAGSSMPALEPPVTFDPTLAYLVLTGLSATGKIADQITLGSDGAVGLDGSAAVDVSACTAYPRNTPIWDALAASASRFKTIFSSAELKALSPVETVSFGFQGSLGLSIKLTLSSLAGVAASAIEEVLGQVGPFQFVVAPSATLSVALTVTGGYRVYAQRTAFGTRFSVTKQDSTSLGINGGIGISVQPEDKDLLNWATSLLAQLAGLAESDVAGLVGGTTQITPEQQTAATNTFGLSGAPGNVIKGLQSLQTKLASELKNNLSPALTAQFTYSWTRLTSSSLAIRFTVPDAVLDTYLPDIISMDLTDIMSADPSAGITVDRWLGQQTIETDISFGFSFGFAGKTILGSTDSTTERLVESNSRVGGGPELQQFAYLGKRGYTASWLGKSFTNYVEIDASTPKFLAAPSADDFQVGLSVGFTWANSLGNILMDAADHGVVLGAFATDDVLAAMQSLPVQEVDLGTAATAIVSIKVPDTALSAMMPTLTSPAFVASFAPNAIARALPCTPDCQRFPQRSNAIQRTSAYAQVFCDYLATSDVDKNTVPNSCGGRLHGPLMNEETARELGNPQVYAFTPAWTASAIIANNDAGDFQDDVVNGLPKGFLLLQQRSENYTQLFDDVVKAFSGLGALHFGCRTFAAALYLVAGQVPGALPLIERTVSISWKGTDGKTHTIVSKGS